MNKIALSFAALTAATIGLSAASDSADARMRFGIGFGFHNNWAHQQVFSNRWPSERRHQHFVERRHERYVERRVAKPSKPVDDPDPPKRIVKKQVEPKSVVAYADGAGRQFDHNTRVWFDGKSSCYTGKNSFSFKEGSWYYGGSAWSQKGGEWTTKSSNPPVPADCMTVPLFAERIEMAQTKFAKAEPEVQTVGKQLPTSVDLPAARMEPVKAAPPPKVEPPKAEPKAAEAKEKPAPKVDTKAIEKIEAQVRSTVTQLCKKYFPSIGMSLDVPCE